MGYKMTAPRVASGLARTVLSSQAILRPSNSHCVSAIGTVTSHRDMSSKVKLQNVLGKFSPINLKETIKKRKAAEEKKVNEHKAKAALCGDYEHHGPPDLTFREFEEIRSAGKATLIDVRNPDELETRARFPGVSTSQPKFSPMPFLKCLRRNSKIVSERHGRPQRTRLSFIAKSERGRWRLPGNWTPSTGIHKSRTTLASTI